MAACGVPYTRDQPGGSALECLVEARAFRLTQCGEPGRHRHRIPRERPRLIDRTLGRHESHQVRTAAVRSDRHSPADDLAERGQIGAYPKALLGATRCHAEARHYFIEDQ